MFIEKAIYELLAVSLIIEVEHKQKFNLGFSNWILYKVFKDH